MSQVRVLHQLDEQGRPHAQAGALYELYRRLSGAAPCILHTRARFYRWAGGCRRVQRARGPSQALQQVAAAPTPSPPQPQRTTCMCSIHSHLKVTSARAATLASTMSLWYRPLHLNCCAWRCACCPPRDCRVGWTGIFIRWQDMYFGTCTHNSRYEVGTHQASLQRAAGGDGYDVFVFEPRQSVAARVAAGQ